MQVCVVPSATASSGGAELIVLFLLIIHSPVDIDEANMVAGYLLHRQGQACEAYPTAPCCDVGPWELAEMAAAMADAGHTHGVDPLILAAIAWHESKLLANALGPNGRDAGLLQISPRWVPETLDELLDPVVNVHVGARVLAWWASRPKYRKDWIAHYAGGIYLELRHSAFQGWVLGQVKSWRAKHGGK